MGDLKIGQTVLCQDGRQGIIRFLGTGSFAAGEWIGLELPDDSGKNDGTVKGERYFDCPPNHGLFLRRQAVTEVIKQPAPSVTARAPVRPTNGAATKPRPSSGITAEVARKRQSLMSAGSAPGSRLSLRSPTKSPIKTTNSSASSATSTPRTGTPATTNRTSDSSAKSRLSSNGRSSMAPPPAARPASYSSRSSIGGAPPKPVRPPGTAQSRHSLGGSRLAARPKPSIYNEPHPRDLEHGNEPILSPPIPEEEEEEQRDLILDDHMDNASDVDDFELRSVPFEIETPSAPPLKSVSRTAAPPRTATNGNLESKAASLREIESLKTKLRIVEKKRQEDREKIQGLDILQAEKDRFETVIQALQKKLKASQQEMADLRDKYNEAEARATQVDSRTGEHESEIELATLDKEMAEERAEAFQAELEALKMKHEELELEAEILREENKELGSVMSPEEKASAGWLQIERERERLRQALVLLRDMSQQTESDLKSQVKELQEELGESEQLKASFQEANERLSKSEATNKHLMEQLEAAESNEDVTTALEHEKEANLNQIELLKQKVQDMEEEIQVNDDLEAYHVSTEKDLQSQLDETEALLHEKQQQNNEQATSIADLEYTLTKFRDVVAGLQSDIDELRRSKDISELEAHEMSSKSRAMMDLNLQLQNSAAKTQMKTIDVELGKIRAEEASQQLGIVQMFVLDSFDAEKKSVLALLCVMRIKSKAMLVSGVLRDRMKDRPHLMQDEPFLAFDVMEKLGWIATCCERFVRFINTCDVTAFSKLHNVLFELEPVERTINGWVEALRRDEMSKDGPQHLSRMIEILSDLAEKVIVETLENKSTELLANTAMLENYCDVTVSQLNVVVKAVQRRLGPPADENEESLHFDKKMDQFGMKVRTIKFLAGKTIQALEEMRSRSMALSEPAWTTFEEAQASGMQLCQIVRKAGVALLDDLARDDHELPVTYATVADVLTTSVVSYLHLPAGGKGEQADNVFAILASKLQKLHNVVEEMHLKAQDFNLASEFEKAPAPWTIRAREIKSQKIISPDVQEELNRLKRTVQEQVEAVAGKSRQLEEQNIKIELLESRTKETKMHSEALQRLENEVQTLRTTNEQAVQELEEAKTNHQALQQLHDDAALELSALKKAGPAPGGAVLGLPDHTAVLELRADNSFLKTEIESLQAAVRWLKDEVHRARTPVSTTASLAREHAWLDPKNLGGRKSDRTQQEKIKRVADQVFESLLEVAAKVRPVVLKAPSACEPGGGKKVASVWRPMHDTPRYQVLRQREEMEKWEGRRAEFVKSVKLANRPMTRKQLQLPRDEEHGRRRKPDVVDVHATDGLEIVAASP